MTDTKLWEELKNGNKTALERLFRQHYDDLFRYAVKFCGSRVMAEDHIQELFLRIWRRKEYLGRVTGVKTYLWTALRRSLITQSKKDNRESEVYSQLNKETSKMKFSVEEIIIQREKNRTQKTALKDAMDELTPRQREIIYLRYYDGMTYEEVESITSLEYQTLRNYVYEALKILEAVMDCPTEGIMWSASAS